jgi:hypothetical protein
MEDHPGHAAATNRDRHVDSSFRQLGGRIVVGESEAQHAALNPEFVALTTQRLNDERRAA